MLLVSIARSRKLLLQLGLQDLEAIGSAKSFQSLVRENSFCNFTDGNIPPAILQRFNRSFAKTPSATF